MKLAEALLLRSDLEKKLASLRERIGKNAVVQEGESPHEDPEELMKEAIAVVGQRETLIADVNEANQTNQLPDGRTLTSAIAHRDALIARHSLYQHAVANSHREPDRYSRSEIKWVATLNVRKMQKQSEDLAQQIRKLNAAIQETNWRVEIARPQH